MPIIRITNRIRPKNRKNSAEREARTAAQSRWLVHGSSATHEERLGLVSSDEANTPDPSADGA